MHWLRHDVLVLAGPDLATRRELFDLVVAELTAREPGDARRIRPVRVALQDQRDGLLAFAGVLDNKLAAIARALAVPEPLVREACVLHRLPSTSPPCWQGWNRLRAKIGAKFHALFAAVRRAMADTPRSSSLVENLNSRLRTCFTLRRHLGGSYLDLLRFLNHRRVLRSRHAERRHRSPREPMTGQGHPHCVTQKGQVLNRAAAMPPWRGRKRAAGPLPSPFALPFGKATMASTDASAAPPQDRADHRNRHGVGAVLPSRRTGRSEAGRATLPACRAGRCRRAPLPSGELNDAQPQDAGRDACA